MSKIGNYLKETVNELKKVTWPKKEEVVSSTMIVIVFIIIMAIILGVLEIGLKELVKGVLTGIW